MNKDKANEVLSITLGILSISAIIALLIRTNFDTNELLSSIVDFTQVAIPVMVLLVAIKIRRESKGYAQIGKEALIEISKRNKDILISPTYNREGYDPEKGKGMEYLFITKDDPHSKKRAKFVPVQPLDSGSLNIYIQKGTLVYGLDYPSDEATPNEIKRIQNDVKNALDDFLKTKYTGLFELTEIIKEEYTAISIDFEKDKIGTRKYKKVITECVELAVSRIKSYKKKK